MDKESALKAINDSLAHRSKAPSTWREYRGAYIDERSDELLARIIEPTMVSIAGETFSYGTLEELSAHDVFAVACCESNWLLYCPELDKFTLAFGNDTNNLNILGFSSNDALCEWLG